MKSEIEVICAQLASEVEKIPRDLLPFYFRLGLDIRDLGNSIVTTVESIGVAFQSLQPFLSDWAEQWLTMLGELPPDD